MQNSGYARTPLMWQTSSRRSDEATEVVNEEFMNVAEEAWNIVEEAEDVVCEEATKVNAVTEKA